MQYCWKAAQVEAVQPDKLTSFQMQCLSFENGYEMCVICKCEMLICYKHEKLLLLV